MSKFIKLSNNTYKPKFIKINNMNNERIVEASIVSSIGKVLWNLVTKGDSAKKMVAKYLAKLPRADFEKIMLEWENIGKGWGKNRAQIDLLKHGLDNPDDVFKHVVQPPPTKFTEQPLKYIVDQIKGTPGALLKAPGTGNRAIGNKVAKFTIEELRDKLDDVVDVTMPSSGRSGQITLAKFLKSPNNFKLSNTPQNEYMIRTFLDLLNKKGVAKMVARMLGISEAAVLTLFAKPLYKYLVPSNPVPAPGDMRKPGENIPNPELIPPHLREYMNSDNSLDQIYIQNGIVFVKTGEFRQANAGELYLDDWNYIQQGPSSSAVPILRRR